MLDTLSMVVVLESFHNTRINLDYWLRDHVQTQGPRRADKDRYRSEYLGLSQLATISALFREPQAHLIEIRSIYQVVREECGDLEAILSQTPMTQAKEGRLITSLPPPARRLHLCQQTDHGILLMIAIALNATLRVHNFPCGSHPAMELESDTFVDHVITLAEQAMQYRPLAAGALPLSIMMAWAVGTDNALKQYRLEQLLNEYQTDFASVNWHEQAARVRARLGALPNLI